MNEVQKPGRARELTNRRALLKISAAANGGLAHPVLLEDGEYWCPLALVNSRKQPRKVHLGKVEDNIERKKSFHKPTTKTPPPWWRL